MHRYPSRWGAQLHEDDFGGFDGVGGGEGEFQAVVFFGAVEWVVEDSDVHFPGFEVGGRDEGYAWGEGTLDFGEFFLEAFAGHPCHGGNLLFWYLLTAVRVCLVGLDRLVVGDGWFWLGEGGCRRFEGL